MINFLEKLVAMLIAFCIGCYVTANYLDKPFVEEQKKKAIDYIQNFISNPDAKF
jgi:hypothetical protein